MSDTSDTSYTLYALVLEVRCEVSSLVSCYRAIPCEPKLFARKSMPTIEIKSLS